MLSIPGVDGVSIVFAAAGNDSAFLFEFATEPTPRMRVLDVPIAIRFAKDLLTPAILATDAEGNQLVKPDSSLDHVDITLAKITLTADFDGELRDRCGRRDRPSPLPHWRHRRRDRSPRHSLVGVIDPPPPGNQSDGPGSHSKCGSLASG